MIVDKATNQQILGCLIKQPTLLSQIDKYALSVSDFSSHFEKYIFAAIIGLYGQGASAISALDISNYLSTNPTSKTVFEQNNGITFLQDIVDFGHVENFDYYYNRFKKFNLLRDLEKMNFPTNEFYETDLTNPRANDINAKFESLTAQEICDSIKKKLIGVESKYAKSDEVRASQAADGILDLIQNLNETIDFGIPVQGRIYNQVISGAQRQALTIRSGCSGLGKTRQAVGDACYIAYPIRFNSTTRQWEQMGSNEKVLFIITEQTEKQIQKMILAYLSDIEEDRFKMGHFTDDEMKRLQIAAKLMEMYRDNFNIIKMPNPTIESVKAQVREKCLTDNIGYVFYDYIFIGPALLGEFKGFSLRNDEVLLMFATALKDLAVELNVAMMTSTQVNASADDSKNIRNEASLSGGRSTINKADNGAIMARPSAEELEILEPISLKFGTPNMVTDIFKVRSGKWTQVRIWSRVNLGTMKKEDLFVTDARLEVIEEFSHMEDYEIKNWDDEEYTIISNTVKELNA